MTGRRCPHGNLWLDTAAPWPAGPQSPHCRPCWAAARAGAEPPAAGPPACSHEGPDVGGRERQLLGLDHRRHWLKCLNPAPPLGENVCRCQGCGPGCPGYAPADGSAPPAPPPGEGLLVTGGIGDAIAVEGQLTPAERERVTTVYYAAPAAAEISALWKALPNYPRLTRHVVLPTGSATLYERAEVERVVGRMLPALGVRDLSIRKQFPLARPYTGSSLLLKTLAAVDVPDRPYAVVVPHSTWFAPAGRAFDDGDWSRLFAALERHDLVGVVLCRDRVPVPRHPRLVDRQGELSILQSVEVVKRASGYLGIDSWCSVLAAKLFPACRLSIKSTWAHGWENRLSYWAPRADFPCVNRRLEVPTWN